MTSSFQQLFQKIEGWLGHEPDRPAIVDWLEGDAEVTSRGQLRELITIVEQELNATRTEKGTVAIVGDHRQPVLGSILALLVCLKNDRSFVFCTMDQLPELFEVLEVSAVALVDERKHPAVPIPCFLDRQAVSQQFNRNSCLGAELVSGSHYVVYSSGTTGTAKAIVGSGTGLLEFVEWQISTFDINPDDRCACLTPPTFDVFLRDALTPLAAGATLVLPGVKYALNPIELILADAVTICHAVPSLLTRWLRKSQKSTESLRLVFLAGEPLYRTQIRTLRDFAPGSRIINLYGPSETTLAKFYFDATSWDFDNVCPVGDALPGTLWRLVHGEVHISPDFQLAGYLNSSSSSFYLRDGRWWFATGDLGMVGEHGLVIEGRTDQQVKVAGVRVNLVDVSAAIASCEGVQNASAFSIVDDLGTRIGAVAQSCFRNSRELSRELVSKLPSTHLPSKLVVVDEMPTNDRGKIDREQLRILFDRPQQSRSSSVDSDLLTSQVRDCAATALGVEIGSSDDFFALGGTSIEAAEWSLNLAKIGLKVTLRDIFESRTPEDVAKLARRDVSPSNEDLPVQEFEENSVESGSFSGELPLTARQRRYARIYLPNGNRNWANMTTGVRLPHALHSESPKSITQAEAAVKVLVSRHDSLRCTIDVESGIQRFHSIEQCGVPPVSELTLAEWNRMLSEEIPVDQYPPHRWAIVDGELRWVIHHLFCDGQSQQVLREEASALLQGGALPERTSISYAEFTKLEPHPDRLPWWEEQLSNPPKLPQLLEPKSNQPGAWRGVRKIPESLVRKSRSQGITPFQGVLLGMFEAFMALTGWEDLLIGTPALGRTVPRVDRTVGNFISLVLIRLRAGEVEPRTLQDRLLGALENQDYQYDQVMDDLGQPTSEDRFPITGIFASQMETAFKPNCGVFSMEFDVKFDAMAYVLRADNQYFLEIQARKSIFSNEDMEKLLASVFSHWEEKCRI